MGVSIVNFVHSVARHLVARAAAATPAVTIAYTGGPGTVRGLWRQRADEAHAADPYTVLRTSGGPGTLWDPLPRASLQLLTVSAAGLEPALSRAQTLFEALLDDDGRPTRMRLIPGYVADTDAADGHWMLVSFDPLQRPSPVGQDGNGRDLVSFNVDVGFYKQD